MLRLGSLSSVGVKSVFIWLQLWVSDLTISISHQGRRMARLSIMKKCLGQALWVCLENVLVNAVCVFLWSHRHCVLPPHRSWHKKKEGVWVCWSAVNNAVMSGSLLSQEKKLTHGFIGWPTFTKNGNWFKQHSRNITSSTKVFTGLLQQTMRKVLKLLFFICFQQFVHFFSPF